MTPEAVNPPAFPNAGAYGHSGDYLPEGGMTLRDWFAGQSIAPVMAKITGEGSAEEAAHLIAETAYIIADAMLSARTGGGE